MRTSFWTLIPILLLAACTARTPDSYVLTGKAQGTTFQIKYHGDMASDYSEEVQEVLEAVDVSLNLWREDSFISKVNAAKDSVNVIPNDDRYFAELTDMSKQVHHKTRGAFNPSVYPLVKAWGFGAISPDSDTIPDVKGILAEYAIEGFPVIIAAIGPDEALMKPPNMELDFNAIAQGYTVDLICRLLEEKGVEDYLVEVGGELRAGGVREDGSSWVIAVEKPEDGARSVLESFELNDAAMATSGNYRKYVVREGKRYSHTIDPISGYPVSHTLLSATVITSTCALADAYATSLMVMGVDQGLEFARTQDLEVLLVYSVGEAYEMTGTGRFEE